LRFENKVVMVTGGAAGIGLFTAENFAKEGARIAICDVNSEAGEDAAKALGPEASFEKDRLTFWLTMPGLRAIALLCA
jgi:NAD(P)-dependent dehydrogenase (short-subunit alcohol dehydrogenase family)